MKNKGYIRCADSLITNNWGRLYIFFKDFRPTHIEFKHWENNTWYFWGVSELFDELKEGDPIPQYDVLFTQQEDKSYTYKFIRLK